MAPFPPPENPADDTERFAIQSCPYCATVAAVLLCLATTVCAACQGRFEVAPLLQPGESPPPAVPRGDASDGEGRA